MDASSEWNAANWLYVSVGDLSRCEISCSYRDLLNVNAPKTGYVRAKIFKLDALF